MRHLALPAVAALALLAGCKDQPRQTPTEPAAAVIAAETRIPTQEGESTLCAAYRRRLGESREALARPGADESLRGAVATYEAVIADACP